MIPKVQNIDHRGLLKGVVSEVAEELRRNGENLTIQAVSMRIKKKTHIETMRIYRDKLAEKKKAAEGIEALGSEINQLISEISNK